MTKNGEKQDEDRTLDWWAIKIKRMHIADVFKKINLKILKQAMVGG